MRAGEEQKEELFEINWKPIPTLLGLVVSDNFPVPIQMHLKIRLGESKSVPPALSKDTIFLVVPGVHVVPKKPDDFMSCYLVLTVGARGCALPHSIPQQQDTKTHLKPPRLSAYVAHMETPAPRKP